MGGSDQWGNITSGTEFIRRNTEGKAYAITTPLLTKSDGKKFGKSEEGNIWLDPKMTSPYKFYQFWINSDDADLPSFTRYFSLKSREEIEAAEQEFADNPRELKRQLAEELTVRIHSREAYESVLKVSELLFNKKANRDNLMAMQPGDLETVAQEIPAHRVAADQLRNGINVVDLLTEASSVLASKGDARRAIKGNALAVNKEKVADHEQTINHEDLLHGKYLMVENGKKNKFILIAE
jgi:tyrosyl-tRNA synthetase